MAESAAQRAIVIAPKDTSWQTVEVLLHFHGHNIGYRERTEAEAWKRYVWQHRKRFTLGFLAGHAVRAAVRAGMRNVPKTQSHTIKLPP